jgi:hypothetical protein
MSDRITQVTCAQALDRYCRLAKRPSSRSAGPDSLHVSSESGVKRVRQYVGDSWGVHDIGPGFATWRGLYGFIGGMIEAEYWRQR